MQEKEASIKGICTIVKTALNVIYSPGLKEDKVLQPKKALYGLICLLVLISSLSMSAVHTVSPGAAGLTPGPAVAAETPPPAFPTSSTPTTHGQPPLSLTLMLIFTGCSVGGVIAVLLVGAIFSIRRGKEK
jgi:hypothetical protein